MFLYSDRYVTLVEDLYVVNEGDHFVSVIVTVDREFSEPFEVSLQLEPSYAQRECYMFLYIFILI